MPTPSGCASTPQQPSPPWAESFSLPRPSWRRSELLDSVHPLDDVVAVLRRVRLVDAGKPTGVQAAVAYETALQLVDQLHDLIRLLVPESLRDEPGDPLA